MSRRTTAVAVSGALCVTVAISDAFVPSASIRRRQLSFLRPSSKRSMVKAPPGSGYLEEEYSEYPDTYDPMMEYPGTMRPGKTKENQPFESLPLAETDPDPVPWPHFQEIEWHHQWEPPHPHSVPMEEFIEQEGRWASIEEEAQMRMDVRRGVRERRELEELEKSGVTTLIVDSDEDDEEEEESQLDLGEGVGEFLVAKEDETSVSADEVEEDDEIEEEDDGDFLLDLGLDAGDDADEDEEVEDVTDDSTGDELFAAMAGLLDTDVDDKDDSGGGTDVDLDMELGLDDSSDLGDDDEDDDVDTVMIGGEGAAGFDTVPLEDYSESENTEEDEGFDDGGFDYDGGDSGGGDDGW